MMRLSRDSEVAIHTLLYCAERAGERVQTRDVASGSGTTKAFVAHIVARLVRCGLVRSYRGRAGGLKLARHPADVPIGMVIRLMQPAIDVPARRPLTPALSSGTDLDAVLLVARNAFLATLDDFTLADLLTDDGGDRLDCLDCVLKSSVLRARARTMCGAVRLPPGRPGASNGGRPVTG